MRELVLPSIAEHYGNEEVVLLDREHDITGYRGNSCVCVWCKGSSAAPFVMDEVP